jgi:AmmeMemoRadiSam system protein B
MFYAGSYQLLKTQIEKCFTHNLGPGKLPRVTMNGYRRLVGLICPHAGYMYSGPVAAHAYYSLAIDGKPDTIVILGPNHTGRGSGLALMDEGVWQTPLGDVQIDAKVAKQIMRESSIINADESAHLFEHSVEVQLPFLQFLYGSDFKLVPICFLMQDLESSHEVGHALGEVLSGQNAVVIASTDMTHYEPQRIAEKNDKMILDFALKMDEERYYSTVEAHNISTCGYGPTVALITASKMLGVKNASLLCYGTSGDITGDYSSVVGYASVAFSK